MKFYYECKNEGCLKKDKFFVVNKCPCKAFSKEKCTQCGNVLSKASKKAKADYVESTKANRVIELEPTETEVI